MSVQREEKKKKLKKAKSRKMSPMIRHVQDMHKTLQKAEGCCYYESLVLFS